MQAYWGSGGIAPRILDPALDGRKWSASCIGRFTLQGKFPYYSLDRRLGGPQALWLIAIPRRGDDNIKMDLREISCENAR
jgi:hypothetical protein